MISKNIEKAINLQINQELLSSYNYLAMSAWFDKLHLEGFAAFMLRQSQEEQQHAQKLFRYLLDRQGDVVLEAISKPRVKFSDPSAVFSASLKQEQANTRAIHELYDSARQEKDYATLAHLQWFLDEQVEEERLMTDALGWLELAGSDKAALLMLDNRMTSLPTAKQPADSAE